MALRIRRFLQSEDGPTAVEYAVMLALIVIVCLTAISSIGSHASTTFSKVATSLQSTANARAAIAWGVSFGPDARARDSIPAMRRGRVMRGGWRTSCLPQCQAELDLFVRIHPQHIDCCATNRVLPTK